jgi:SiaC family regulatory phosphoprotein
MQKMKNIEIEAQKDNYYTPRVSFNTENGICEIAGESYLEDAYAFYKPLKEWLEEYIQTISQSVTLHLSLTYLNTASSKSILSMLKVLKAYQKAGGEVTVSWKYRQSDLDMLEDIEDLIFESELKIELIPT